MVASLLLAHILSSPVAPPQFDGEFELGEILRKIPTDLTQRPIGERMAWFSDQLIGTPYVGWTLERPGTIERCYVSLEGLDCVTFFETTLGLSRAVKDRLKTPSDLVNAVEATRYRGGRSDGTYLTRLHYTSDWMWENARRGNVLLITKSLPGAEKFDKRIRFMSSNAKVYRQLDTDPSLLPRLRKIESEISARSTFYVPLPAVAKAESKLQTGDIVGITTSTPGMDCSHTGIIRVIDGVPHFMHASSTQKKVILDVRLSEYLMKHPKATGVMIARPLEVR